ncbi:MAG: thioredoxin family protein [Pseudomonadota bacterium]
MTGYKTLLRGVLLFVLACFYSSAVQAKTLEVQTVEQAYPGLASNVLKTAKMIRLEKGLLLKSDGIEIQEALLKRIVDEAEAGIRPQLEKNLFFLLEQEAMKRVLVREAQRTGISMKGPAEEAQVIQSYLDRTVQGVTVSDEEAKAFYDENKALVQDMPFEKIKETIKQVLVQQKKGQAVDNHVRDLIRKSALNVNEAWVKKQFALAMNNPVDKARRSGKPTMVEFGAKGCVPCDMMQPILDNLKKKYPEKLNVVFVHVGENYILGSRYGIRSIPVQVFFDQKGEEVFRHVGFFAEPEVLKQLAKLGVE